MLRLNRLANRGFEAVSRAIRQQPDYDTELSNEYLVELGKKVDTSKPDNFTLKAITEPGW